MDVGKFLNVTFLTGPIPAENDEPAKPSGFSDDAFDRKYSTRERLTR